MWNVLFYNRKVTLVWITVETNLRVSKKYYLLENFKIDAHVHNAMHNFKACVKPLLVLILHALYR